MGKPTKTNPLGLTGAEYRRHRNFRHKYGVGQEWYNERFVEQKGYCAICGKHQSEMKKALAVDHNHNTKQLRGLLCFRCNAVLGHVYESVDLLAKMADYLEKWSL